MSDDDGRPGDSTFASTMEAHERRRIEVEEEYGSKVEVLHERVRELGRRIGRAGEAAGHSVDPAQALPPVEELEQRLEAISSSAAVEVRDAATGWPAGGGLLRRWINRFVHWLLRDYLEVLDRRRDRLAEAADVLVRTARELVARDAAVRGLLESETERRSAVEERLVGTLQCTAEALGLMLEVDEEFRRVVDAKDAELLQRAVHGQARKAELIFDELARQQEALLAELVGRRQELEELVRRARGRGESEAK